MGIRSKSGGIAQGCLMSANVVCALADEPFGIRAKRVRTPAEDARAVDGGHKLSLERPVCGAGDRLEFTFDSNRCVGHLSPPCDASVPGHCPLR